MASVGTTDVLRIGRLMDTTARGAGAVVSFLVVALIMLHSSLELGLVLIIGAPVGGLLALPVMRPLERRQWAERQARGAASAVAADTVAGLRVLRGLGGEADFNARYLRASQTVRQATVRTALAQSVLAALQVFIPGAILVGVTYVGAHMVLRGHIRPGQLVSDYAYAAFLVLPVQSLMQLATSWSAATLAGTPLDALALETVRRRVLVLDRNPHLLSGTVAEAVDVPGAGEPGPGDDDQRRPTVDEAIATAAATDILTGLDEGLAAQLSERGRSLSGGQRQRLLLAAALRAGPDVLVLHEPTSAVDAHTEALIAERLADLRRGRTTVVIASSPLLLARADTVVLLSADGGSARGTHAQLMASNPEYRQLVARELT